MEAHAEIVKLNKMILVGWEKGADYSRAGTRQWRNFYFWGHKNNITVF